ncbi:hypothetical protein Cgig2_030702 [Carnegiea gigantea]|uniref:Uncharacterized protein n=1 Tax=Carnegiea gigantea TaxID=171969 RepID=A0A9Q1GWJ9_9CARY|nr:hypothetical protein Cgig2_030702 [Carnegiea gigantea]
MSPKTLMLAPSACPMSAPPETTITPNSTNSKSPWIACKDPEKLTIVGKRIQNVLKQLKELDGVTSESKMIFLSKLIFYHQNIATPKEAGNILKEEKKKEWSNNKKERDFVKLVESKAIMIVVIVFQNRLPNLRSFMKHAFVYGFGVGGTFQRHTIGGLL